MPALIPPAQGELPVEGNQQNQTEPSSSSTSVQSSFNPEDPAALPAFDQFRTRVEENLIDEMIEPLRDALNEDVAGVIGRGI